MHSVHHEHENNAQTGGYTCTTYLHVCVRACVSAYMFQLQNHVPDFDLITQLYANEGHCQVGIFNLVTMQQAKTCNLDTLLTPSNLTYVLTRFLRLYILGNLKIPK
jgi:hypothetical protein